MHFYFWRLEQRPRERKRTKLLAQRGTSNQKKERELTTAMGSVMGLLPLTDAVF